VKRLKMPIAVFLVLLNTGIPALCAAETDFRMANRWISSGLFTPFFDDSQTWTREYLNAEDLVTALENRLMVHGTLNASLDYTVHVLTTVDYSTRAGLTHADFLPDIESTGFFRHPDLEWTWKESDSPGRYMTGITVPDRLMLRFQKGRTAVTAGRQPIGLSACFFLTVNDFFEPFAAEAIYRDFKPGVDAVVIRYFPGPLSESAIHFVAGYDADGAPDWDESAALARMSFNAGGFQWDFLAGKLPWRTMAGASVQGELGAFGVRAEGHVNFPADGYEHAFGSGDSDWYARMSGGFDYRFQNSLHVFVEYMYLGNGYASYTDYLESVLASGIVRDLYSGRHYAAVAAAYQWHPLFTSQMLALVNLDDESALVSGFGTYSLADEADLVIGGYYTLGDQPEFMYGLPVPRSEFGSADRAVSLELRVYL
jgi:hypothetical protein